MMIELYKNKSLIEVGKYFQSMRKIGKIYNCSYGTIKKRLIDNGVAIKK